MKGLHLTFLSDIVAHKLHYSKVDTIGISGTRVKLTSWETHLEREDIGSKHMQWQTLNLWWLAKRSIQNRQNGYFDKMLVNENY
jgi:hypothetical protein